MNKPQILIIGAGISGCTLAERYATQQEKQVLIVEKRDHIGGNCFDYTNEIGLRVSKYGPHYFHTNNEKVWEYLQQFSSWRPFEARCLSIVDGVKVPIPVNIDTINKLFSTKLKDETGMRTWLDTETENISEPKNSEEAALRRVGRRLYEKMFKNYTKKQWDKDPTELDPSIMDRLPVRFDHDDRYFTDKYQAYPIDGYTKLFEKMTNHPNIAIMLRTDWEEVESLKTGVEKIFFTGRIDSYFKEKLGKLEYRSLRFEMENIDQEYFQDTIQENYPDSKVAYTRIVEYKHQTGQRNPMTTIGKEYPTWEGEPYYPVLSEKNKTTYQSYQAAAIELEKENIYFVGRLANYKYVNMDQAVENALNLFHKIEKGPQ